MRPAISTFFRLLFSNHTDLRRPSLGNLCNSNQAMLKFILVVGLHQLDLNYSLQSAVESSRTYSKFK